MNFHAQASPDPIAVATAAAADANKAAMQQAASTQQIYDVPSDPSCVSISMAANDYWCQTSCANGPCPETMCKCGVESSPSPAPQEKQLALRAAQASPLADPGAAAAQAGAAAADLAASANAAAAGAAPSWSSDTSCVSIAPGTPDF